ncbi:MAG: acyltransferase family protein [Microthrixaceae bacterium]
MGRNTKRSVYLDALRAFALTRVVLYHSTNLWTVTAFTAMPLMFFIAGSLYANSIERRPQKQVTIDRFRRILFPYWLYVVAMVVLWAYLGILGEVNPFSWVSFVMPVLSFGGPEGPGAIGSDVSFTWIALWYLQMHLIFSLAGGWMRRMQQRHGERYWIALVALTVLLMPIGVGGLFFWALCWSIGYLQHDGTLSDWLLKTTRFGSTRRWQLLALATGPIGFALFFTFHESMTLEPIAGVGALLLGAFWLVLALGLRERIEPSLETDRVRSFVHWMSSRSLTIYLWHMAAVYAVVSLALPGSEYPLARFAWVVAAMVPATMLFGWAEDLAARKRPTLWPRLPIRLDGATPAEPTPKPRRTSGSANPTPDPGGT